MLNVAIIGTGNISPHHINAYLEFGDRCKIVALVDIYKEKAEQKNEHFKLNAQVYDDYKELLGRNDIDLVSVCTPPFTHAQITIDFLNDNKHVVVEKPMAASLEECDAMISASRKSKTVFSVIAQNRFKSPVYKLKQVIDGDLIGKIVHAQVDSFWWRGHCYYDLWWRGTWDKEGGGCTLNHAVHHIDMLLWMMGRPKEVISVLSNVSHDNAEVEDISMAVLKYGQGTLAGITSSVVHHGEEQQLIFQGEKARISAPWKVFASQSASNGFPVRDDAYEARINDFYCNLKDLEYEGHTAQIQDVLNAIENHTEPLIKGIDGKNTIELITAIYKSGIEGGTVLLPITQEDEYYKADKIVKDATRFYKKTSSIENFENSDISVGSKYKY